MSNQLTRYKISGLLVCCGLLVSCSSDQGQNYQRDFDRNFEKMNEGEATKLEAITGFKWGEVCSITPYAFDTRWLYQKYPFSEKLLKSKEFFYEVYEGTGLLFVDEQGQQLYFIRPTQFKIENAGFKVENANPTVQGRSKACLTIDEKVHVKKTLGSGDVDNKILFIEKEEN